MSHIRVSSLCALALIAGVGSLPPPSLAAAPAGKAREWRHAYSQSMDQVTVQTNARREKLVRRLVTSMTHDVLEDSSTPPMELVPIQNKQFEVLREGSYSPSVIPQVKVTGIGAEGKLLATLLLPVSGHTGADNARKWATTDTYNLYVEGSAGRQNLVAGAPSKDVITAHELQIQLEKDRIVRLVYDRSGSFGPGGFASGRIIELIWDGT